LTIHFTFDIGFFDFPLGISEQHINNQPKKGEEVT